LLEHLQGAFGRIAQDDGVGLDVGGDAGEVDVVDAGGEVEREMLSRDEEVLVVDGERGLRSGGSSLVRQGKGTEGQDE
jgi:hypothetical protein